MNTLILGGGFGGIAAARHLRSVLPAGHAIRLVTDTPTFQIGATKTWVMIGEADPVSVQHPIDALREHGIEVEHSTIRRIDAKTRTVHTDAGERGADYLVIALGAARDAGLVPGLLEGAETFYTSEGAVRLRETLSGFDGGRIVILIPRVPFSCPPAPYEGAMLLEAWLEARGIRERSSLGVYTVEKAPMATAGPEIGRYVVDRLKERGVGFHPGCEVQAIDSARKVVSMKNGDEVPFDLLIAIPPHVAPPAVRESGLTGPSGWISVDPRTLEITGSPASGCIFAIGDVTGVPLPGRFHPDVPLSLPKAGVFAEAHARTVAARIAAHAQGRDPGAEFDGRGFCYIELGRGEALRGDGSFFELPHPRMTPTEAGAARLAEKHAWAEQWLANYL